MKLTKEQKVIMMQYVLDCITPYEDAGQVECPVTWLIETFKHEMGVDSRLASSPFYYNQKLADFLKGLPSSLNIAFSFYDILHLPICDGLDLSTEDLQDEWLDLYWLELAKAIHNLMQLG